VQFGRPGGAGTAAAASSKSPAADRALAAADGAKGGQRSAAAIPLPALVDALIAVRTHNQQANRAMTTSRCMMSARTRCHAKNNSHLLATCAWPYTHVTCNCIGLCRALSCFGGAQVGGVSEAALSIRRHAVTQMHSVIMQAVEAVEPAPQVIHALHFSTGV
jgi:hypothetical protein